VARRATIVMLAMAVTFLALRGVLYITPNSDFNVAGYNIHHLFTGVVILTLCGIPLVIGRGTGRGGELLAAGFGIGLAFVLDEWVYLIVTDGSNASYLLPVSLSGGAVLVGAAVVYTGLLSRPKRD
jgi:hypothetical protein